MATYSPLTEKLIQALRVLPGVGLKSAQRMALHLLERDREGALRLADQLRSTLSGVSHCQQCRLLCEADICHICSDELRNQRQICVVETPANLSAIESTGIYEGVYFVLMGHLSPIDGIGPEEIGLHLLFEQIEQRQVEELILATSPTVEGEATAHYIRQKLDAKGIKITRLAHGIPMGAELDQVDGHTLHHALQSRKVV
ncbi:recombination mediator RecR [Gynuella sunshinyii]|uniref:Recombination protein RecR n=1 Tax=Gynuella sunshinyii YC6258 TaxID=1445510 RepID=A0A0C5W0F9_9GAMM|nr:recombination mediator RecR [Gynuella sunshinyii]AJQ96174.1 recombinational DNA repair protein (RecF pathway) [Gynuella sunshinyii YC6258]